MQFHKHKPANPANGDVWAGDPNSDQIEVWTCYQGQSFRIGAVDPATDRSALAFCPVCQSKFPPTDSLVCPDLGCETDLYRAFRLVENALCSQD